ncbi:hypothetical protein G7B40_026930 [Aetokthonos hydrillicola Thurmond2011]|uniref:Uncharacterized protein n=2 Tax=Aetokthonos TaxID=1550243 RepID=A0AAP5IBK2_9CYAN|nr:hypothetical protein [Aetokthonos hydrillicola]MBO3461598.1 hypothetical protein [Aetokthonos hydrillicola CCALA 1050]MBW4589297.1 hypothetical protein [Aetokthonos hydrillicola CCALA 1050]MDR9898169.1 hypothetical protein [Aetokthonos hydrillicola Thurmond2011]
MKRRQFIQNIVAGTAATSVLVNLGKKAHAYDFPVPSQSLYGVRAVDNTAQMFSLNLTNSSVNDLTAQNLELTLQPNERISGFTVLADGRVVVATSPATTSQNPKPSRLLCFSDALPALQGLDKNSTIESLCAPKGGGILSIISLNQGTPPFKLAKIDLKTGQVSFINNFSLPENQRFSNLTQCPKGHLYATNISGQGSVKIVQIFLDQGTYKTLSELRYNGKPLSNDVQSQAYSPLDNGTFVLANPTYQSTSSVFWVNEETGVLELVTSFAADKIAFAPS